MQLALDLKDYGDHSGKVEEWTRYQVMCDLGDSSGRVRLELDLGNLKLIFIWTRRVVVCGTKGGSSHCRGRV